MTLNSVIEGHPVGPGEEVHHLGMFTQFIGIRGFLPDKPPRHGENVLICALIRKGKDFYGFLL